MIGTFTQTQSFALNNIFALRKEHRGTIPAHKRALDILIASLAVLALAPLFLATALAVKLTSKGSIFFVQQRVGHKGELFGMIKFRSMYMDAEARRAELLKTSDREGICFKSRNDPRITTVGRFIRRYSIDELPQLINVIKGDMSLVGPRPALPAEVAQYPAHAMERLQALPGITGIWQVSGRADIDFDQMVQMDVAYARNATLRLDLLILALTFNAVISAKGAY